MYIWGTINPPGEDESYNGLYLTKDDIHNLVKQDKITNKPVKIEHKGIDVGKVVSTWVDQDGSLQCVLDINQSEFEGAVVSDFVQNGVCKELSLGYVVDMQHSQQSGLMARNKQVVEVSIVKRGARDKCFIHGFSQSAGKPK
jgi:phage head maturation protease